MDKSKEIENLKTISVLNTVNEERLYQKEKYGTAFDDRNTPHQWFSYIGLYGARNLGGDPNHTDIKKFRVDMLKVAALAVAAVEAIDRAGE